MFISRVESDVERAEVQQLFADHFEGIAPNAVPESSSDHLYRPLILAARDEQNELIGALLANRPQIAAGAVLAQGRLPTNLDYSTVIDDVCELDLMAVPGPSRRRGIGGELLAAAERHLIERGTKVIFGCVTDDLDVNYLRNYYERAGFRVLQHGEPLPMFRGRTWVRSAALAPAFYFYRQLPRTQRHRPGVQPAHQTLTAPGSASCPGPGAPH